MYTWLTEDYTFFPDVETADEDGVLALGGDLSVERLKIAYSKGIFPWYNKDEPIIWWCPDPRMVLKPKDLKISKSMKKLFREEAFKVTINQNFKEVVLNCSKIKRRNQECTWIHKEMIDAYLELHKQGIAKSIEVWQNNTLVGGFYGIEIGKVFTGESMFSKVSNASKYGFIDFVQNSKFELIDCQTHTNHLESLGAKLIPRNDFLQILLNQ